MWYNTHSEDTSSALKYCNVSQRLRFVLIISLVFHIFNISLVSFFWWLFYLICFGRILCNSSECPKFSIRFFFHFGTSQTSNSSHESRAIVQIKKLPQSGVHIQWETAYGKNWKSGKRNTRASAGTEAIVSALVHLIKSNHITMHNSC